MISAKGMEKDRQYFEKLGKGDIVYEYASGKASLLCLRGATIQLRTDEGLVSLKPHVQRQYFTGYFLKEVPAQYQVTTAEGQKYELNALSVDKGDTGGAHIEYWKSDVPRITFDKEVHDFGEIGPGTNHSCEFKFTNTGNTLLKITRVGAACACTTSIPQKKKQYAPGESGIVKVTYSAGKRAGPTTNSLYALSNDKVRPRVTLTINANIVAKVQHEPERLNLLLKKENAGCPEITLTSLDNQPFAIKQFKSTGDSITADFDSSVKKTKFVLQPKVNVAKLQKNPNGRIEISLTHPECGNIALFFAVVPEFKATPPGLFVFKAEPGKSIKKEVIVFNNHGEDFEVESASSDKGIIKVISRSPEPSRRGSNLHLPCGFTPGFHPQKRS